MLSLGIYACQDKEDSITISEPNQTKSKMTVLGKKLQNPFSVKNMQKAYQNIKTGKAGARVAVEDVEIKATHLYLKFKPQNDAELMKLKQDTTLKFFTRPIDYEIAVAGDYYHDPS